MSPSFFVSCERTPATTTSLAFESTTKGETLASKFGNASIDANQSDCFSYLNASSCLIAHFSAFFACFSVNLCSGLVILANSNETLVEVCQNVGTVPSDWFVLARSSFVL